MRHLKNLAVTGLTVDRRGLLIGFAIDPETGETFFIPAHIVETMRLEADDNNVYFQAYTQPQTDGNLDHEGKVLYVKKDSIRFPGDDDDDDDATSKSEAMAARLTEMDDLLAELQAVSSGINKAMLSLRNKIDEAREMLNKAPE